MPHEWRSAGQSTGSPAKCATSERPGPPRGDITAAFADRASIDWAALLERARAQERASLLALQRLDSLRGHFRSDTAPAIPRGTLVLRLMLGVAVVQTAGALAYTAVQIAAGSSPPRIPLLLSGAFAIASALLAPACARDPRIFFLLATFALTAGAFARVLVPDAAWPGGVGPLVRGLFPEAFAQAALWQFAVVFPEVRRFAPIDVAARRAASAAWLLGSFLFVANVLAARGILEPLLGVFGRDHAGNLFWDLFALSALPAVATILVRAWRAPAQERRRVLRFAAVICAGAAPLLLGGITRLLSPDVDRWMSTAVGPARTLVDAVVLGGLAAMPIAATLAVIVDRPFDAIVPVALRGWLARSGDRIGELMRSGHHQHERLATALDRVRLARAPREAAAVLRRELQAGVGVRSVRIVEPSALPAGTALIPILLESSAPIDLSRDDEPFVLLPMLDRAWIEQEGVAVAAPIALRDGTLAAIVLLGSQRSRKPLEAAGRWFVATLLAGAAAAWETTAPSRTAGDTNDAACECPQCGLVAEREPVACGCGTRPIVASVPHTLADRFVVRRRVGTGGMGIVYLARDTVLGRDVALKTLTKLGGARVVRIRDEARVMAGLNHDALATIYDLAIWNGTPVLVVEYFPGGTLADRLADGPLPAADALALGIRLAQALCYMHDRGELHRDIKPSNIGFTAEGQPRLLDFGLAAVETATAGTPAYLPPEALEGAPPDAPVDLWGLAKVLDEAIGGRSHLTGDWDTFLTRALAPNPDDRFRTSADFLAELVKIRDKGSDKR